MCAMCACVRTFVQAWHSCVHLACMRIRMCVASLHAVHPCSLCGAYMRTLACVWVVHACVWMVHACVRTCVHDYVCIACVHRARWGLYACTHVCGAYMGASVRVIVHAGMCVARACAQCVRAMCSVCACLCASNNYRSKSIARSSRILLTLDLAIRPSRHAFRWENGGFAWLLFLDLDH